MLRESEFFQNRKIRILLCVELIFILIGVIGLFCTRGEVVGREDTALLSEEGVSLPAGVYTLKVFYEAEDSNDSLGSFGVAVEEGAPYRTLLSNPVPFYPGLSERECQFYLLGRAERLKMVSDGAEGVRILGAEIFAGNEGSRIYLFWVVVSCLVLDAVLASAMYHRRHPISPEKQLAAVGILLLTLIVSLPVLVDYNLYGEELIYHLRRIEALAGHSYGGSLVWGDMALLVPVFLRILGFPVGSAYSIFLVLMNLATVWIAYFSFFRCLHNRFAAFFGSALYTLAPYRVYTVYSKAAVGKFTAMIFLPLLVWCCYRIFFRRITVRRREPEAIREEKLFLPGKAVMVAILLTVLIFGIYQVNDILLKGEHIVRVYSAQSLAAPDALHGM